MADASAGPTDRHEVVVVRHGETAWTISGQHTGRTDVPLTDAGRRQAGHLAGVLAGRVFTAVLTSPLRRATETADLAGFGQVARPCDDLLEWDYGAVEGRTTAEVRAELPHWSLWRDGSPGGESTEEVGARVDRLLTQLRAVGGDVLVFSHGHLLRVLGARWIGLDAAAGGLLLLSPASVSVLGWEREQPVISLWNQRDRANGALR